MSESLYSVFSTNQAPAPTLPLKGILKNKNRPVENETSYSEANEKPEEGNVQNKSHRKIMPGEDKEMKKPNQSKKNIDVDSKTLISDPIKATKKKSKKASGSDEASND